MPTDNKEFIGKKLKAEPVSPAKTNIDTDHSLEDAILTAAMSSNLRTDVLESFSSTAQSRETEYELIDTMTMDSIIASAVERYAEDITQTNSKGQIFWVESNNSEVASYVQYLLDKIDFDRNAYKWAYMLTKYGDVYVKLVRRSEFENSLIFGSKNEKPKQLNEDVNIVITKDNDHYADTLDTVKNPAEMFELTKYGKTIAFVKAPTSTQKDFTTTSNSFVTYRVAKKDVDIYSATEFAHGCLESSYTRSNEELDIFRDDDNPNNVETFEVKRGAGILNDLFKVWRQYSLMENSILLSRITRASITRAIQMEVGDMPQNQVVNVTRRVKTLLEQKSSIEVGEKMSEYTNPGSIENIVILPTRNGKGAITMNQIGGDYDPKTLTDLDHFVNKLAGGLKIPKPLLGFTDDNTGFNGGTSLTILNSDYGKAIKKSQKVLIQMVTDIINLLLIDKGKNSMINNFKIMMQSPITQEEIDLKNELSSSLRNVSDIMTTIGEIDDVTSKMKILKSLLSETLANQEITNILSEYIKKLEKEEKDNSKKETESEDELSSGLSNELIPETGSSNDFDLIRPSSEEETEEGVGETPEEIPEKNDSNIESEESTEDNNERLPSGEELGVDLTTNTRR